MTIAEIEVQEISDELADVTTRPDGELVYEPGSTVSRRSCLVTVRTADGAEGHHLAGSPGTVTDQLRRTASTHVLGREPVDREPIWQDLWHALRHTDRAGASAIDIALWDLVGKRYGASVSRLLGGRHRDGIKAYASTFSGNPERESPETYADFAADCLESGYQGFKIHPFGDPDVDIQICRTVAERVGGEMDLMLDPSSCYDTYVDALRVGRVLDELEFYWYEDPLMETGESAYAMRRLTDALDTPILGLEHSRTEPFGVINHLFDDALDIARVDTRDCGITGALKVAHAAEAAGLDVEPHGASPPNLQLQAAIRNTNYAEDGLIHPEITPNWRERTDDGTMSIPDEPGVGRELDRDRIEDQRIDRTLFDD